MGKNKNYLLINKFIHKRSYKKRFNKIIKKINIIKITQNNKER